MVSVGEKCRLNLLNAQYVTTLIHKRCSGVRGDLQLIVDGFRCKRCDGTIQEADLAEDLMMIKFIRNYARDAKPSRHTKTTHPYN